MRHPGPGEVMVAAWMTRPAITVSDSATAWAAMERFVLAGTRHLVVVTAQGRYVAMLTHHQLAALWPADS
jgi:CBS domain-containing protein